VSRTIALTGLPGAGKTTVGAVLAEAVGRRLVDTDSEVERHVGRDVPTIFAEAGEGYFRSVEQQVVRVLSAHDDLVLSLGGGAVLSDANVADLLVSGVLVHLDAPTDVLAERLADDTGRPLLADDVPGRLRQLHAERDARYREVADVVIDATGTPVEVAGAILTWAVARRDVLTPSEHEAVLA
jgi:shikimate kinase